MKKLFCLIIFIIVIVSLSACTSEKEQPEAEPTAVICHADPTSPSPIKCHVWVEAGCTNPKYCELCGIEDGEPLGHTTDNGYCSRCNQRFESKEKIGRIYDKESFKSEFSKRLDLSKYNYGEVDSGFYYVMPETTYLPLKTSEYQTIFGETEAQLPFTIKDLTGEEWKGRYIKTSTYYNAPLYKDPIHVISFTHKKNNKSFSVEVQGTNSNLSDKTIKTLTFTSSHLETGDSFINILNGLKDNATLDDIILTLGYPYRIDYKNVELPPDYDEPDYKEIQLIYYVLNDYEKIDTITIKVHSLTKNGYSDSFKFNYINKFKYVFRN